MTMLKFPIIIIETARSVRATVNVLGISYEAEISVFNPSKSLHEATILAVDLVHDRVRKVYPNAYLREPNYIVIE